MATAMSNLTMSRQGDTYENRLDLNLSSSHLGLMVVGRRSDAVKQKKSWVELGVLLGGVGDSE